MGLGTGPVPMQGAQLKGTGAEVEVLPGVLVEFVLVDHMLLVQLPLVLAEQLECC